MNENDNYKTFREAYDLLKPLNLVEDDHFRLDVSFVTGAFVGSLVSGVIKYNDLSKEPGLLSTLPVFVAIFPGTSKEMHDNICQQAKSELNSADLCRSKAAIGVLMSSAPILLYSDPDFYTHPLVNPIVIKLLTNAITYDGGDIPHVDGKVITEKSAMMHKGQWLDACVYVNPDQLTVHPKQIHPNHSDLLDHKAAKRDGKETECGLTRSELARNGLGVPDFF